MVRVVALMALGYGVPGTGTPIFAVLPVDDPGPGRDRAEVATCTREGHGWRITLGARSTVVRHSIGMLHLVVLLANPNVEVRAVDLVAGVAGLGEAGLDPVAQPVLDRSAVQDYRHRLTGLTTEIDEAEAAGDAARARRAHREREWLIAQLGAGTGLGGRPRRFADGAENARLAVGKAIRRAIARVAEADRIVGDHLTGTVHTGIRCAYFVQCPPPGRRPAR
ncbi:hypothetical protein COUCH_28920 [Couchioplanes caeruleus]|uniref:hypothetical protein n=1 Tax=Couchioplanes caeruleus TaxID=56438 RepID=UPI0020C09F73|nr:hypothetical protein [Couchioplanes caeruleus]UQU63027.1 hypothetical protein COUCH_28920 [Couchioplanes caeruleus]